MSPSLSPSRFALRKFDGTPFKYFRVEPEDLDTTATVLTKAPSHHILCVDVSGSMSRDLPALKNMVAKLLTLEEFNSPNLMVSLVTYSSSGDVRVHFERATVAQVMAPNSPQLGEIQRLQVRGLTCISQGLRAAEKLVDDKEMTCISLHSDGFANDESPLTERRDIAAAIEELQGRPNVFVNTVAYGPWADFGTLNLIANGLSGTCLQATDIRQVYDAMRQATGLLAGNMAPVLEVGIGSADNLVVVVNEDRKVLGTTQNLVLRGVRAGSRAVVCRLYNMTAAEYEASTLPESTCFTVNGEAVLAYALTQVAQGNLNTAKYALVAYKDANLLSAHYRALTGPDVALMVEAINKVLFDDWSSATSSTAGFGLNTNGPTLLEVLGILAEYRKAVRVNVVDLLKTYQRRGLKKIPGRRLPDGTIEPPATHLIPKGDFTAVPLRNVEINHSSATVNLLVAQPGTLVRVGDTQPIDEVAGVPVNPVSYRTYTVVGDGQLNLRILPVRISDKRCFAALSVVGVVSGDFNPESQYDIDLSSLPLVSFNRTFSLPPATIQNLFGLTVVQKVLRPLFVNQSVALTAEQIAALREVHITPAGYYSAPTTVPYTDLKEALGAGTVDTRPSYKVVVGTTRITSLDDLKSGNAYLQRRFVAKDAQGVEVEKPTLENILDGSVFSVKPLSARVKLDAVDDLSFPIYEDLLGLRDNGVVSGLLRESGLPEGEIHAFKAAMLGGDRDSRLEVLSAALAAVDEAVDEIYHDYICPLVFYVGATGLVPEDFDTKAMTAEQLGAACPTVKLSKSEKENGTFFLLPEDRLLTVYLTSAYFSTDPATSVSVDDECDD